MFLLLFTLQLPGESLFLRIGTVRFQVEYPESLFDGTFHIGGESALQTGVRHVRIQIRDAVRIIEEPLKGVCREFLAETGAVIDLPVHVVNEGRTVDASFIVLTEYRIYAFPSKQTDKCLPVATATVHGKCHFVPNLRLPFFLPYTHECCNRYAFPVPHTRSVSR